MLKKALKCISYVIFNFASFVVAYVSLSKEAIYSHFEF